jgi:hypothetical protein
MIDLNNEEHASYKQKNLFRIGTREKIKENKHRESYITKKFIPIKGVSLDMQDVHIIMHL